MPILLSFRFVLLLATLGAVVGALLMFWEGGVELHTALVHVLDGEPGEKAVVASVMGSVDKLLFGIVLVIIAYAVTFGFVLDVPAALREKLPRWAVGNSIGDLKHTFFEVILVYLAVDFATDVASTESHLNWETLVMPCAILLLAGAIRLLTTKGGAH